MSDHILAIATYGSQRVKHPRTGQVISAYKIGYSTAAADVLLAVCPYCRRCLLTPRQLSLRSTCGCDYPAWLSAGQSLRRGTQPSGNAHPQDFSCWRFPLA